MLGENDDPVHVTDADGESVAVPPGAAVALNHTRMRLSLYEAKRPVTEVLSMSQTLRRLQSKSPVTLPTKAEVALNLKPWFRITLACIRGMT
jgi:hypothetical protein